MIEDKLDNDFLLEEFLEAALLDLDDSHSFRSCSVSVTYPAADIFLIIFSSMSSNQSSSCYCIYRGSK